MPDTPRRLVVLRHAKSSWKSEAQADHERPLNDRGRRDAPRVAARLAELGWTPDAVWSSDAARTRETWELAAPAFDPEPVVHFTRELYLAGLDEIRTQAAEWDDAWRTVLVLGHNPGWEEAVGALTGRTVGLTTANAALLAGRGGDWTAALLGSWELAELLRPKEL